MQKSGWCSNPCSTRDLHVQTLGLEPKTLGLEPKTLGLLQTLGLFKPVPNPCSTRDLPVPTRDFFYGLRAWKPTRFLKVFVMEMMEHFGLVSLSKFDALNLRKANLDFAVILTKKGPTETMICCKKINFLDAVDVQIFQMVPWYGV